MVKFLIIRFSSIGDIVLTTPLIRCLKQQVENAEIHYLVKSGFSSILSSNPYIDRLHTFQKTPMEIIQPLKNEGFDYILDLQNNIKSLRIKRSLKRMYFTLNKTNAAKWLLVNFKINRLPDKHIVDRYMETAHLFDISNDNKGLDYFIPDDEEVFPETLPKSFGNGYIAIVIGAKHNTKKLPDDKLTEIIGMIHYPVIIIGGAEDKSTGEIIVNSLPERSILNGCGIWSINQSASIIRQSRLVITHDTGMMHIAAALKKKIITIWGNTIPQFGMYAYLPNPSSVDFQVSGLKCRPCSKLGKRSCPKIHFKCMREQDSEKISEKANILFKS